MQQACARFERHLKRRFGHSSTPKHYISDLNIFVAAVGDKAPEVVTAQDIDGFVAQQITADLSPTTINRRLSCIHSFFEFLAAEQPERNWPNPVNSRRHRLKAGKQLPRDASENDITRLFAVIDDQRDLAMFGLMVGAGLRVGEVAALQIGGVEPSAKPEGLTKVRVKGKGSKERVVWLTPSLRDNLDRWLEVRPTVMDDHLFLNCHGRPLSVSGIQYRLHQYCQAAGVTLSCHQLRHTFCRRLVENGLPVESLAKLLGHNQLHTTQRYIDGADPTVRADFAAAMAGLESASVHEPAVPPVSPTTSLAPQPRQASQDTLEKLRQKLTKLPSWMGEVVDAYLSWRWPTWRARTAYNVGSNLISLMYHLSTWLTTHRQVNGWETFRRADLEAWLQASQEEGVSNATIAHRLALLRILLRFMETRDYRLDAGLFRVQSPKPTPPSLPRYLPESAYRRLEATVLKATAADTYDAVFDRAWFLTLAHTGVRISELLDLRLGDLNLETGYATVCGGKPGRDRVVFMTPPLTQALNHYLHARPQLSDNDHVFVLHERSPTVRTMQRRLARYGQQAGVEVSPHRLRHTMATRLINQGMPIHSLRKLLGHENLNTTQIYARIYDQTLHEQFKAAMSSAEVIAVEDWPGITVGQRELAEEVADR